MRSNSQNMQKLLSKSTAQTQTILLMLHNVYNVPLKGTAAPIPQYLAADARDTLCPQEGAAVEQIHHGLVQPLLYQTQPAISKE